MLKILIIDDNPIDIAVMTERLKSLQVEILVAIDRSNIVAFDPDIIILDLFMPNEDGEAICSSIKKEQSTSHIPIIMLSSSHELKDKLRCFKAGAIDYFEKPIKDLDLKDLIGKYSYLGTIAKSIREVKNGLQTQY
jgi:CheY-like chemotaxis protein